MSIQIHLRDTTVINATASVPDAVHSSSDPAMILIKDGAQTLFWISESNFDYMQAV
jgi:hypothetical protein